MAFVSAKWFFFHITEYFEAIKNESFAYTTKEVMHHKESNFRKLLSFLIYHRYLLVLLDSVKNMRS